MLEGSQNKTNLSGHPVTNEGAQTKATTEGYYLDLIAPRKRYKMSFGILS